MIATLQISNCPTCVGSCQKSSIPTDEEFAAIIEQSKLRAFDTLLSPEDIFIFNIKLCNNDIDSHGEIFTEGCLKQLAELFVGKSSEDGFTILSCKVECFEDRTTKLGDTYSELIARAYMIRNTKNQHMISKIESKEIQHVHLDLSV